MAKKISIIYSNNLDVLFHTPANYCKLKLSISIKYRAFEAQIQMKYELQPV